jgi:ElaB/YqjD/DUF883 family membrane-anchored ribosome-binding protein
MIKDYIYESFMYVGAVPHRFLMPWVAVSLMGTHPHARFQKIRRRLMYTSNKEADDRVADVKLAANKARNEVRAGAANIRDEIEDAAHRTGRSVREFLHAANDEFHHAQDVVTNQIRTKPVQSTLVALGAGFVLGALFRR